MSNKGLLTIIIVILLGILGVVLIDASHHESPGEQLSNSISEAGEEIGDEIDDATTN